MSTKLNNRMNNLSANDASIFLKNEEKTKLTNYENININNLGNFYNKDESFFKKKVDKLNLRFYLEQDKFMNCKHEMEKSQDNLFHLLFKQISNYIEEIEKLNCKIKEKEDIEKFHKLKNDELSKRENSEKEVPFLKNFIRILEKKINDNKINEDKLKKENDSFKRQLLFYKDKLKLEINGKKENLTPNENGIIGNKLGTTLTTITNSPDKLKQSLNFNFNKELNENIILLTTDEANKGIANLIQSEENDNEANPELIKKAEKTKQDEVSTILCRLEDNKIITPRVNERKKRNISGFDSSSNNKDKDNGNKTYYSTIEKKKILNNNKSKNSSVSTNKKGPTDNISNNSNNRIPVNAISLKKSSNITHNIHFTERFVSGNRFTDTHYQNLLSINNQNYNEGKI